MSLLIPKCGLPSPTRTTWRCPSTHFAYGRSGSSGPSLYPVSTNFYFFDTPASKSVRFVIYFFFFLRNALYMWEFRRGVPTFLTLTFGTACCPASFLSPRMRVGSHSPRSSNIRSFPESRSLFAQGTCHDHHNGDRGLDKRLCGTSSPFWPRRSDCSGGVDSD
jgi:hypothetical protein